MATAQATKTAAGRQDREVISAENLKSVERSTSYFDQFGNRFVPVLVIWRRPDPSRWIVKTCSFPARVETNATCRPFGENAGLSLLPIASVRSRVLRVAKSKILITFPPPTREE